MIHAYSLNGINIVLDVESGAIHILDELPFIIIKSIKKETMTEKCPDYISDMLITEYKKEDIDCAYSELYYLYKNGELFAKRDYPIKLDDEYPVKALCLHISHDCNMRCKYCFAEGGDFAQGRKNMPFEVAKKAIDFIVEKSEDRKNIEVDFFGGEPLMNFDVVKKTVKYARFIGKQYNKNFRFTLTTNGILLNDDIIDYLNSEMSNVVLSLDGREEINNKVRVRVDGSGSYDKIVPKYKKFVEKREGKNYYIRGTFTAENLDFKKDVLHFKELGFKQVSIEPVVLEKGHFLELTEEMLPRIFEEYENLAEEIIKIKENGEFFNFFHFMIDLDQGPCVIKRVKGCGAGCEYVAVTPEGDIYPCHRFVGKHEFIMGNVLENFDINEDIRKKFSASTVLAKPDCEKCFAKYYCSGGCAANNFNANGDIFVPHKMSCETERKRIECAIMIKAHELLRE